MLVTTPVITGQDLWLDGFHIPAGTPVVLDTKAINTHPSVWQRPHDFWPERFLEHNYPRTALHVFGLGARRCLGQNYADTIVKVFLSIALQHFRFLPAYPVAKPTAGPFGFPPPLVAHARLQHL